MVCSCNDHSYLLSSRYYFYLFLILDVDHIYCIRLKEWQLPSKSSRSSLRPAKVAGDALVRNSAKQWLFGLLGWVCQKVYDLTAGTAIVILRESENQIITGDHFHLFVFGHCLVKCGIWTRALSETKDMFRCKLPGRSTAFFFNRAWFVHSAGQQVSGRCFLAPLREVGSPWQPDPEHWPGTETLKIHEIYTLYNM